MNALNRLLAICLILLLMVLCSVVLIVPRWVIQGLQQVLTDLDTFLDAFNPAFLLVAGVVLAVIVDLAGIVLLWLEVRRPRPKAIRVQKVSGGLAEVTVDSVARRLEYHIDQLADVIKVKPKITARGGGVDVELFLETSPDIDVPMKTEEVCQVAREVVEERMGLKLRKVIVNIKHADFPKAPAPSEMPPV